MIPREVVTSEEHGPFAMKTDLGWGVVGLMSDSSNESDSQQRSKSRVVLTALAREISSPSEAVQLYGCKDNCGDSVSDSPRRVGLKEEPPSGQLDEQTCDNQGKSERLHGCVDTEHIGKLLFDYSTKISNFSVAMKESKARLLSDDSCVLKPFFGDKLQRKFPFVLPQPNELEITEMSSRSKCRKVHFMFNEFWERWRNAYLSQIQQRADWQGDKRDLQVGEVDIISGESLPRCQWKLDHVFEVNTGSDGKFRKVKVQVCNPGLTNRGEHTKILRFQYNKPVLLVENEN